MVVSFKIYTAIILHRIFSIPSLWRLVKPLHRNNVNKESYWLTSKLRITAVTFSCNSLTNPHKDEMRKILCSLINIYMCIRIYTHTHFLGNHTLIKISITNFIFKFSLAVSENFAEDISSCFLIEFIMKDSELLELYI